MILQCKQKTFLFVQYTYTKPTVRRFTLFLYKKIAALIKWYILKTES